MWRVGEKPEASLPPLLLFVSQCKTYGLPYSFTDYLMLVDWTGRSIRADKRGHISAHLASILSRLGLDEIRWLKRVTLLSCQGNRVVGEGTIASDLPDTVASSGVTSRYFDASAPALSQNQTFPLCWSWSV